MQAVFDFWIQRSEDNTSVGSGLATAAYSLAMYLLYLPISPNLDLDSARVRVSNIESRFLGLLAINRCRFYSRKSVPNLIWISNAAGIMIMIRL